MIEKIKRQIDGSDYDFLRENPDLENAIYLTISGSYGYGTNIGKSDIDLRGVLVEKPEYIYGLRTFEQFEDRVSDTVIYGLKKYINLCINANPSALELLGTSPDAIVLQTDAGELIRKNAYLFLSKRVVRSFGNYATAQLRKFLNAICHDHYSDEEQEVHLSHTLSGQIYHFNQTYEKLGENGLNIYMNNDKILSMDITLKGYPVRDFAGIYGEMQNTIKTYKKLNHRNRKKDDAHLYKHAMHLIRLLMMGTDILHGKGIITRRDAEHDFLMDIRNGAYSFDEIREITEKYQKNFGSAADNTNLPTRPDLSKVEDLMMRIYRKYLP